MQEIMEMAGIVDKKDYLVSQLSGGWKQRLALGCAIIHKPKLLFLDEPTSGADPKARKNFWQIIENLIEQNITVIVTTHFMEEAEHCDEMVFLDAGKMVAQGSPKALKDSIKEVLVSIASDDSIKLRGEIQQSVPVLDAYIFGRELRLLMRREDLGALAGYAYNIIEPSMEDVFSYYLDKRKGGGGV